MRLLPLAASSSSSSAAEPPSAHTSALPKTLRRMFAWTNLRNSNLATPCKCGAPRTGGQPAQKIGGRGAKNSRFVRPRRCHCFIVRRTRLNGGLRCIRRENDRNSLLSSMRQEDAADVWSSLVPEVLWSFWVGSDATQRFIRDDEAFFCFLIRHTPADVATGRRRKVAESVVD